MTVKDMKVILLLNFRGPLGTVDNVPWIGYVQLSRYSML